MGPPSSEPIRDVASRRLGPSFVLRCLRPSSPSPRRRDRRSRRRSHRRRSSMASRSSCLGPLGGPVWEGPKTAPKCSGLQIGPDPSQIDLFLKEHIRDFGARPDRRFWALRPVGFWRCLFSCFCYTYAVKVPVLVSMGPFTFISLPRSARHQYVAPRFFAFQKKSA